MALQQSNLDREYWALSVSEALRIADSAGTGLTESQIKAHRAIFPDADFAQSKKSGWTILISQFNSPLILLLLVTAALSFAVDDSTDGAIILLIVGLSGVLTYWQEKNAADAVSRLLSTVDSIVLVKRENRVSTISRKDLVVGDIVLVKAGTVVPADCRLIESNELLTDESVLTGESFPVEKHMDSVDAHATLSQRSNCLFLGTHVVSGSGTGLVFRIGRQTEFGNISAKLSESEESTDFERGIRKFGSVLVRVTICLVLAVVLVNVALHRTLIESLLFALALAVGMTPQLLPAITGIVLARGANLMAQSQVIVKRLIAIENLGSMDTLCMDKTGTITVGTVELHEALNVSGQFDDAVLRLAFINAISQKSFENPIDTAIAQAANKRGIDVSMFRCRDELPYDFKRRRLTVLVTDGDVNTLVVKGAYRSVLEVCDHVQVGGGLQTVDALRSNLDGMFDSWSARGFRVLAIATRITEIETISRSDEGHMTLVGLLVFSDPIKSNVGQTLDELRNLGLKLKLVTGDNAAVAKTLAEKAGFANLEVATGRELAQLDPQGLCERAMQADIFAEVEPDQKAKIVQALRKLHCVVGFLGDGINDAPALHASDVGISVSTAVDVAKEAAQVVLLQPDLNVLLKGITEGRRTMANTLKYLHFAISANFGYMLSMAIASMFLPFLPLLPSQILLINLMADFPAMTLAVDRVDKDAIKQPLRWSTATIINFMLKFGIAGTCSDLITFGILLQIFHSTPDQFRVGWFTVSIFTGLLVMLVIRTRRPFFQSRPSNWLLTACFFVSAMTILLPYTPLGTVFGLHVPRAQLYAAVIVVCSIYVAMLEFLKRTMTEVLMVKSSESRSLSSNPLHPK